MTVQQACDLVEGAKRLRYLRQLEAMARKPKARQKRAILARARRRRRLSWVWACLVGLLAGWAMGTQVGP